MSFDALEVAHLVIEALREPVATIALRDRDLARQIRRAASSIALDLAEGRERIGGDRLQAFRTAHGSTREVRTALRVATGWGSLGRRSAAAVDERLDRLSAMCWRLTHP